MKALLTAAVFAAVLVTASAQTAGVDPDWVVPAKAAQQQNPLKDKPDAALGGKKIFARSCVTCHGDERNARKNNAPDLSSAAVQADTDGALFWRISNGNSREKNAVIQFAAEPQRWQLVLYIRSLAEDKHSATAGGEATIIQLATLPSDPPRQHDAQGCSWPEVLRLLER